MAGTTTTRFAFHYRGGFTDINQKHRFCCICIYNSLRGFKVGVPTLVGNIFTTLPWRQSGVFNTHLEATNDWLFFATPPTNYSAIGDTGLKWKANQKKEIQFPDHQRIVLTPLYLRPIPGRDVDSELKMRSKKWALVLYECGEFSLYCLSFSCSTTKVDPEQMPLFPKSNPPDSDPKDDSDPKGDSDSTPRPPRKAEKAKKTDGLPKASSSVCVEQTKSSSFLETYGSVWFANEMTALCDGCEQFMCFPPGHIYSSKQGGLRRLYNPPWFSELVPSTPYDPLAVRNTFEKQGEKLFGDYEWGRFDLLVLPPSFPYGGMENPRMVFLTPTVIRGDATGAQVVAHELAHSWTGNLITNINNEHFWLNEGFTTYAEKRIVEVVQGADRATLNIGIGWRGLTDEMERFKDNLECTKLWNKQEGVDPDDVYSQVPYEKGFQFVLRIERQIGRTAFDEFLKKYIATFKFKSIDANTFLEFLKANIPGIEKEINLQLWTEGVGIPEDAYELASTIYTKIISLAKEFKEGRMPGEDDGAEWNEQEWKLYLENLPKSCEPSQVMALDKRYRLAESKDYEVKVSFLQLAVASKCREYHGEDKTEDSRPEKLQKLAEKTPAIV